MRAVIAMFVLLFVPGGLAAQNMFFLADGQCAWGSRGDALWGASIRDASSEYNTTEWAARQALGRPDVFPRYGDVPGAWAPSSPDNPFDYVDVLFPQAVDAGEIWVFETNGGGVYLISAINPDGSMTALALEETQSTDKISVASQIVVPVVPARSIIGVRIATSPALAATYAEVDAVAALPTRPCSDARGLTSSVRTLAAGIQLPASALPATMPKQVWASAVLDFGTEYDNPGWAASQALGAPDVFPNYGDLAGAWAPATPDGPVDLLSLQFPETNTREIWIYQTFGAGGTWMVRGGDGASGTLLWAGTPAPQSTAEARVLRIVLPEARVLSGVSIVTSPRAVGAYTEIDAVALVPAGQE